MAASLVATAFGPTITLYDALQCQPTANPSQLKKAYYRVALLYHPDKVHVQESKDASSVQDATLRFQAVSAAYKFLMDPQRRARYDSSAGRSNDDDEVDDNDNDEIPSPDASSSSRYSSRSTKRRSRDNSANNEQEQQRWDEFFKSVFQEVVTAGSTHGDADTYRGSDQEKEDVLHYFSMCKGHWNKVVECVVHGTPGDVGRWKRDIIEPAMCRGEIDGYDCDGRTKRGATTRHDIDESTNDSKLVDSENDKEEHKQAKIGTKKRLRKAKESSSSRKQHAAGGGGGGGSNVSHDALVDTDDEKEEETTTKQNRKPTAMPTVTMSRKDKMEYRVAKKRKQKAEREMEVANLFQSESWTGMYSASNESGIGKGVVKQPERPGTFRGELLSSMEKKYGGGGGGGLGRSGSTTSGSKKRSKKKR